MSDILVISATRLTKIGFERRSLLASSLRRMSFDPRIKASISYKNRRGLPAVFNSRIVEENRGKILAFTHDDVRFDDYWLSARLDEGLRAYDVIGVAGCRRRYPNQASWAFTTLGMWDIAESLSGAVAHFPGPREAMSYYGQAKRRCKLLDGLLIAVRASTLIACGLPLRRTVPL